MLEVVGERLLKKSVNTYHFLLYFVQEVLVALQSNFREDWRCAGVLFADIVASHGPHNNLVFDEGISLIKKPFFSFEDKVLHDLFTGYFLSDISSV